VMAGRYRKAWCSKCECDFWAAADSIKDGKVNCKCGHLADAGPRSCFICLEASSSCTCYSFISNGSWTSKHCKHRPCFECMQQYVSMQIEAGCWNIRCPGERCNYMLLDTDIHRFVRGPDARKAQVLLEKYRALRSASYGEHLCSILRGHETAAQTPATEAVCPAFPASTASCPSLPLTPSRETADRDAPAEFEDWALNSCQACPKCLVIVRKETGCDHIQCKCGASFQYCCGYPSGDRESGCVCRSKSEGREVVLHRLGRWLRVNSKLDIQPVPAVLY